MSNNSEFTVNKLFNVEGWVAVVTGGGTGIGLMAAQSFANNGAKTYIVGRRQEVLDAAVKAHGSSLSHPMGKLIPVVADVTSKDSIRNLVAEISKQERHIDVLVNNAGIDRETSEVERGNESAEALSKVYWDQKIEDWEDIYRTNVISYFFTSAAFLPLLSAGTKRLHGHSASIINISSISGIVKQSQHHHNYNVSKAGTIHLNTIMAQEFSSPAIKVRVNSIAPGVFPSEMTTSESNDANKSHISADGYREKKNIAAGRPGRDDDMAQAVLMLAVNDYANGQVIAIDGGYLLGN